jgi:hypothetical protein
VCVCTCLLFVVDCFNKKSVVAIISLKRKIDLATKVKNGGKVKLYFTLERKAAVQSIEKIFDLDPGKLYFINKRVKLREKKYFLNLRKNNECSK